MNVYLILTILVLYFVVLLSISHFTSGKADNDTFFTGNKNNKWYVVAFGMVGASLSGVTFISIPGTIHASGFTYLQIALGYILGYAIIAFVLLPLYYRLNLVSIYEFLKERFGEATYKMGALFFILSRIIGAALRLYLVANVLQEFVFKPMGVPFELTVVLSILLIWVYTFRGGIKTIVWTDSLQTLFMLISVGLSVYMISGDLNLGLGDIYQSISDHDMGEFWQTSNPNASNYWWKGLLGGMFLTLGMTGVDQDMMQKNLSCKSTKDAQKNMLSLSVVLFFVNVVFVTLGGLLYLYVAKHPELIEAWAAHGLNANGEPDGDLLFATVALESRLPVIFGVFFLLGLIAAAYSSADSALTSLTTSVSVDFFDIKSKPEAKQEQLRKSIHIAMSVALLITILIFKWMKSDSVIWELFKAANFTYGPLLGLFMFGVLTKKKVDDGYALAITLLVAVIVFVIMTFYATDLFGDYKFGSELLGINALLVFVLLAIGPKPKTGQAKEF